MSQSSAENLFRSENVWPFLFRKFELEKCVDFLAANNNGIAKYLRISGASGVGKSFFVRELLLRCANTVGENVVIYVDSPPSDLEASELFRKIDLIISSP
jgi:predicted NACHT family NTPase